MKWLLPMVFCMWVNFSDAAHVYYLPAEVSGGAIGSNDQAVVTALRSAGHSVTVGPIPGNFNGFPMPPGIQAVFWRLPWNHRMPQAGQQVLLDFIAGGGGLVISGDGFGSEWSNAEFNTIRPALPFTASTWQNSDPYTLKSLVPDARMNSGLPSAVAVPNDWNDAVQSYTPRGQASTFYTFGSPAKSAVIGWRYLRGKVITLPFVNYPTNFASVDCKKLVTNAVTWVSKPTSSYVIYQSPGSQALQRRKFENYRIGASASTFQNLSTNRQLSNAVDFNRDGYVDFGLYNLSTGGGEQAILDAPVIMSTLTNSKKRPGHTFIGFGDFNRDGWQDCIFRNDGAGRYEIDLYHGFYAVTTLWNSTPPRTGYTLKGIGDFNGNGYADMLWVNQISGALSYWQCEESRVIRSVDIAANFPPGLEVTGFGDIDGDGFSDILMMNQSTGTCYVVVMNKDGRSGSAINIGTAAPGYKPVVAVTW